VSELNTTGYAVLGLLSQHPWSAYELTQFMRISYLRAIWPRAESRLYEAPKKLVSMGYAAVAKEQQGKRSRSVYSITGEGRRALRDWLKSTGKDVIFEHEALLKLANSDAGTVEDLGNIIAGIRASTESDLQEMRQGLEQLVGRPLQISSDDKYVINTLVNSFVYETLQARTRWLSFAETFTRDWDDLAASEAKLAATDDYYRQLQVTLSQLTESEDGE
jgi:PadR family transcriptional regulator AphA